MSGSNWQDLQHEIEMREADHSEPKENESVKTLDLSG